MFARFLLYVCAELPPRARRIQADRQYCSVDVGTTSACAENTNGPASSATTKRNYLRVRGEYVLNWLQPTRAWELPPRARRIPGQTIISLSAHGTTSACAENTTPGVVMDGIEGNYLRVRGEYEKIKDNIHTLKELPPRARRILKLPVNPRLAAGTTSACAENTATSSHGVPTGRNYLRVRGEYADLPLGPSTLTELPPRARRILVRKTERKDHHGTTSACAENTGAPPCAAVVGWNYLRVRGEYGAYSTGTSGCLELPPRARRILLFLFFLLLTIGTTSACAENT